MIESKLSFYEVQIEGSLGQAVEVGHLSLCVDPETLDTVDLAFSAAELIGTMIDSEMFVKTDIDQATVPSQSSE